MPITVMGELLYGALNSKRVEDNVKAIHSFYSQCMPISVDEAVAMRYALVRMDLKKKGRPIPENDIWIAAACLEVDAAIITKDQHFSAVAGLEVLSW